MNLDEAQLNLLYRYCFALTLNADDAYDLLQSSVEKRLRHAVKNNQPMIDNEMAYMRRTIRNHYIDLTRKQQKDLAEPLEEHESTLAIDTHALDDLLIDAEQVEQLWSYLNAAEREILFLWAIEELSASRIAEELDKPRGTVLSTIHRMRIKIINRFDKLEAAARPVEDLS